ncbi:unnamed protein product [Urochloa decumbens]|uniref:Uncharacterized protein n=1 Tax=Urochloa decumbens TaxID=240449 RepID=A0ABC8W797_9POAL
MGTGAVDGGASPSWGGGRLAAEGCTSTGATMSVAASASGGGHRCCSCGGVVNIYVNNNVQGVTNSVLLGSKVVMRDPGARVTSRWRPRRGPRRRKVKTNKIGIAVAGVVLLSVIAAAAVFCLNLFVSERNLH